MDNIGLAHQYLILYKAALCLHIQDCDILSKLKSSENRMACKIQDYAKITFCYQFFEYCIWTLYSEKLIIAMCLCLVV